MNWFLSWTSEGFWHICSTLLRPRPFSYERVQRKLCFELFEVFPSLFTFRSTNDVFNDPIIIISQPFGEFQRSTFSTDAVDIIEDPLNSGGPTIIPCSQTVFWRKMLVA